MNPSRPELLNRLRSAAKARLPNASPDHWSMVAAEAMRDGTYAFDLASGTVRFLDGCTDPRLVEGTENAVKHQRAIARLNEADARVNAVKAAEALDPTDDSAEARCLRAAATMAEIYDKTGAR